MFSRGDLVPIEGAAFLLAANNFERTHMFGTAVGEPLGFGLLFVQAAFGSLTHGSKIHNLGHELPPLLAAGGFYGVPVAHRRISATALNTLSKASFGYIGKDYGKISIHG